MVGVRDRQLEDHHRRREVEEEFMKRPDERRTYGKVDFGNEWRSPSARRVSSAHAHQQTEVRTQGWTENDN